MSLFPKKSGYGWGEFLPLLCGEEEKALLGGILSYHTTDF